MTRPFPAALVLLSLAGGNAVAAFRAGACAVDVSPAAFPIRRSGGFLAATGERLEGRLYARALALEDGRQRVVILIADTLMMPRELLDRIKQEASRATGLRPDRMLIAATHTHSAPPVMGALGADEEPAYAAFFAGRLGEAIRCAVEKLQPARAGWAVAPAPEFTHCRRWILRPDRIRRDPFGELTVRANMHPGYQNPEFIGPAGPVDSDLSLLAVQTPEGRPLALLANYGMHYVGVPGKVISPDYYGPFVEQITRLVGGGPDFVAMMSQGTSGDQHWMDYARPKQETDPAAYAARLAQRAFQAYRTVRFRERVSLEMREALLELGRRVPGPERLAWARALLAGFQGAPRNQQEVYAREQLYLAREPRRQLKLQALRIGELGIAAIPCEVFGITGLKIKAASPLAPTFTIELANGAEGYIPPPEQHLFGGYTTWPARTAGLETAAEPKILEAVLGLLEQVAGRPRRTPRPAHPPAARALPAARPFAWWRLEELAGPEAHDSAGRGRSAIYEGRLAFHLEGAPGLGRAPYFAGGRLHAPLPGLGPRYAVTLWFWMVAPGGVLLETAGRRASVDPSGRLELAVDGKVSQADVLIAPEQWRRLTLASGGARVRLYLDGAPVLEAEGAERAPNRLAVGEGFEGRIDEVAVFAGALSRP